MTLIAIGGAEDKFKQMKVLKAVLARSNKAKPRVHVITTATGYPDDARERYEAAFGRLNVKLNISHITTPQEADAPDMLARIKKADVVFFSGGDQSRLAAAFNGTEFLQTIRDKHKNGAVIAGTSAGAAIMAAEMITGGHTKNAHKAGAITSGKGFGLAPKLIIDTHFHDRGRLQRLFNLLARHPGKTGIGLDEDTAALIHDDGSIEAIGSGAVTIVKGKSRQKALKDGTIIPPQAFSVTMLREGQRIKVARVLNRKRKATPPPKQTKP